ncbi:hypothetical protein N9I87_02605 [Gammaproteobacteria bacterium]|jgi:quinoprotein glucose dehydrogenase|nr:hypothetical protein [Gammaproteobacteria bacterium]
MGVVLLGVGGSLYYAFAGVVHVATGVLLYRGDKRGATLYGAFFSFLPRCFFIR